MSRQSNDTRSDRIILNIGGRRFAPYQSTLRNHPDMPLAWIANNVDKLDYDPETKELFFDRHPMVFAQILNYFQTGRLHCPRGMCGPCFQDELSFWGIQEQQMESCCWSNYTNHREAQENIEIFDSQSGRKSLEKEETLWLKGDKNSCRVQPENFWDTYKPVVWEGLEEPYSSTIAKIYGWTSLVFVVISIITATLWTIPAFQVDEKKGKVDSPRIYLLITEGICTAWFSCEFVLRVTFCPSFKSFVANYRSWIDIIAIVTAYFIILNANTFVVDALTIFRVFRIFRFLKLLQDLRIIGKTFNASSNLFLVLLFVLLIPVLICSSVVFYTESNHGDSFSKAKFANIPASIWWGITTITTVGYGDLSPATLPGRIFGIFCALCGVLLVSMSASIAGSSFVLYYNLARARMKIPRNREKIQVDVESLPTVIINVDNIFHPSVSSSPEDSGFDRYTDSEYKEESSPAINHGTAVPMSIDSHGKDNGIFTLRDASLDTQLYDEGYFDVVKKSTLPKTEERFSNC